MRDTLRDPSALVTRLIMAEVLARRGEGPLVPLFKRKRPAPRQVPPPPAAGTEETDER